MLTPFFSNTLPAMQFAQSFDQYAISVLPNPSLLVSSIGFSSTPPTADNIPVVPINQGVGILILIGLSLAIYKLKFSK